MSRRVFAIHTIIITIGHKFRPNAKLFFYNMIKIVCNIFASAILKKDPFRFAPVTRYF